MMLEDSVDYIRCNIIHVISISEIVQQLKIIEKIHTIFIHIFILFLYVIHKNIFLLLSNTEYTSCSRSHILYSIHDQTYLTKCY